MESVQQGAAVQLTIPDVGVFQTPIACPRPGLNATAYRSEQSDGGSACTELRWSRLTANSEMDMPYWLEQAEARELA